MNMMKMIATLLLAPLVSSAVGAATDQEDESTIITSNIPTSKRPIIKVSCHDTDIQSVVGSFFYESRCLSTGGFIHIIIGCHISAFNM